MASTPEELEALFAAEEAAEEELKAKKEAEKKKAAEAKASAVEEVEEPEEDVEVERDRLHPPRGARATASPVCSRFRANRRREAGRRALGWRTG